MKSNNILFLLLIILLATGCGGSDDNGGGSHSEAALVSITVSPATSNVFVGANTTYAATGNYADGTSRDITAEVSWRSSDTAVAAVAGGGVASALAQGSATISAALGGITGSAALTVTVAGAATENVLPITVNGSLCSAYSYINKPCVSVTICTPGTSTCQTINDILLDTGSYGLRIFKQVLTSVSLTQVASGSGSLAQCIQYADGSADWGPVQTAGVVLGNEPAVLVPIQVIDAQFFSSAIPATCDNLDISPSLAGFNGILGVGLFAHDCGQGCVDSADNGVYFSCSGASCTQTAVSLADQVQNPVALLPLDNNGVILLLPHIASEGALSVNGSLVLGIGTRANNTPAAVTTYPANAYAEFTTISNNISYDGSFIDSGSNGLFFPTPASGELPVCTGPFSGWFCPTTTVSFSATTQGAWGTPSGQVSFQIGNFPTLYYSPNYVFNNIGGNMPGGFAWGLPFFLGRNVYVGMDGKASVLGVGPYWAY